MYTLRVFKLDGEFIELKSNNLKGLKETAISYNREGASVEIIKEVTVYRNIQMK